ncbi:DUF6907 domain-containing protein [Streptomyces sp. NPDC085460]|uniref:DUF6907 domain-containing protein n=1 Tax=Streptomyces sp. NPDC085460 TaxID=3365723 RepID=UPI0037CFAAF7
MTRHVDLTTIDHETVRLVEPEWCTGHADHTPCHRVDLAHTGAERRLAYGSDDLLIAMLTQDPYAKDPERRRTGLYVEQTGWAATLDPDGVRRLAATLTVHAMHLRQLADRLARLGDEEAGR